jgi:hypothetical protein
LGKGLIKVHEGRFREELKSYSIRRVPAELGLEKRISFWKLAELMALRATGLIIIKTI